jgi:hypothetical protein
MHIQHTPQHTAWLKDVRTAYRVLVETTCENSLHNIKMDLKETVSELAQYQMISDVKSSGSFTRVLITYANKDLQDKYSNACNHSFCN